MLRKIKISKNYNRLFSNSSISSSKQNKTKIPSYKSNVIGKKIKFDDFGFPMKYTDQFGRFNYLF